MENLNFGTFSGIVKTGIDAEIKTSLRLTNDKGLCTLAGVAVSDNADADGVATSKKLQLVFHAIDADGGGCTDTITTQSPSIFQSGLNKLKYLFNAVGATFPKSAEDNAIILANKQTQPSLYDAVVNALNAFITSTGVGIGADKVSHDASGNIVFFTKSFFEEALGRENFKYIYTDLSAVDTKRRVYHKALNALAKDDEAGRTIERDAYIAFLDAQPVAPCLVSDTAFADVKASCEQIRADELSVYITAKDWGRKVQSYKGAN